MGKVRGVFKVKIILAVLVSISVLVFCLKVSAQTKEEKRQKELEALQERFQWWPTDATPGPVKDERGGYWWWPTNPGEIKPWGNRGYIYVWKVIFDYKADELPPPQPQELRPSLLIKKIIKNVKIYFDYDKAELRNDHLLILEKAVKTLVKNPQADILITGNCDQRGSEGYNLKLGQERAEVVKQYMVDQGIAPERVRIVSRGKLDAVAPINDLVGMQKDRNAQFMIAEVEEVMIPYSGETPPEPGAVEVEKGKYVVEKDEPVESEVEVSTMEYTVKKNDSLSKIAQRFLGGGHRWKYLWELNKERIPNPDKLKAGTVIIIPIEQEAQKAKLGSQEESGSESLKTGEPQATQGDLRQYTIKQNDSLWKIAQSELGDGNRWKEIYELNKGIIEDSNKLTAGKVILIPAN